ncbi:MAG: glycosyltransferase, partial [Candidatus Hydrogenedentales bacterium]
MTVNKATMEAAVVSFIVPAYDEERYIGDCINAIHQAARERELDYEVIVANDASTDATARIAAELGAKVVDVHNRRISATRNAGAVASRGAWLIFVDADTQVNAKTVAGAVDALQNGAAGGGSAFDFDGRLSVFGTFLQWIARRNPRAKLASGCFLFCTREAFIAVGGFADDLAAAEEA